MMDEDFWEEGLMFDGSSIAGWKSIDESDMKLMPDPASVHIDPFYAETTMCVHCDVVEPDTGEAYARDPRRPPSGPRPISSRRASAIRYSSARKPNSSCSTT